MKNNLKNPRFGNLTTKITIRILAVLFVIFALFLGIRMVQSQKDLEKRELEKLTLLANENANTAKNLMESMVNKQGALATAISNLNSDDKLKMDYTKKIISQLKAEEEDILSFFFVADPGRFISKSPHGISIVSSAQKTYVEDRMTIDFDPQIYDGLRKSENIVIVDPYEKNIDGVDYQVISILQPIFDSNKNFIGVIGSNIDVEVLNAAKFNTGGYDSFTNQIICGHQTFIVHTTNPDAVGENFSDATISTNKELILNSANDESPLTFLDTDIDGGQEYRAFIPFHVGSSEIVWLSGTGIDKTEFDKAISSEIFSLFFTMVIGMIIMAILFFFIIRQSLLPIRELEFAAKEMAEGKLSINVKHHSNDELGSLAKSFKTSSDMISSYVHEIDQILAAMANGNFDVRLSKHFIGDFKNIETSIIKFVHDMTHTLSKINQSSQIVSTGSQQVSIGGQTLSQGSVDQSSSLQELSENIKSITKQINKNAVNTTIANEKITMVGLEINEGNRNMQQLVSAMNEITRSSNEIRKIIKVIDDIAFQTNILALNASVEAAGAGSFGKAFAVVAHEVKKLAAKSTDAVNETTELINNTIQAIENGKSLVDQTADSMNTVTEGSKDAISLIDEISNSTQEQSGSMKEINLGISQIADVVQINSSTAEESAATSEELSEQAQQLKELLSRFKFSK